MKFNKTTLPNGLRLITIPNKGNPAVTVLVVVETGSNYESREENGISHFLEHMMFKGTLKRPSALSITSEFDGLGAQNNAFTAEELTGYYAKAEKRHFKQLLDVISDMYLNPTLPAPELEKERGVIMQELKMYEDLPRRKVAEVFQELLYGDTPAGRTIIGPEKNIRGFTQKDFIDYRNKHYVAKSTMVIVAGDVREEVVRKEVENAFRNIPGKKKHPKKKVVERQSKPEMLIHQKKTDQTHLIMGFRAYKSSDKRQAALTVLAAILGGSMSSRLFQKLREEMGVCYYVRASVDDYTDHGALTIAAGIDKKRTEEVVKVLIEEVRRLTKEPVSDEELKRTKEHMTGSLYLGLETTDALAEFYAFQEVTKGSMKIPEEIEKDVRGVTASDIMKVAKDVFKNEKLNLAIVGEVKNIEKLRSRLTF